ncbi:MAG TPA: FKBP-type peptidyl-prolyl cis-trans isomerase [Chitinophagaceae bacterium]|nr:FKBP-type peptidyl-prolyl cis-trans isomerase [Chitinophagaceae bacterium]
MKKVLILVFLPVLFFGCLKSGTSTPPCTDVTPASEEAQIIAFCHANSITYTKDSSGVFYQILDPGTGTPPTLNSTVSVTYVAKFLDGILLDQTTTTPFTNQLNGLIAGWQIGLRLIAKGGHIKMVVPSSLCYGCNGRAGVPPNAIIYFDITLVDIQ